MTMRILLAVDDSPSARVAVSAVKAMQPPGVLLLLHVVDVARYQHPSMPPRLSKDYYGRVQACLMDAARHLLDEIKAGFPPDFGSVETSVVIGDPVKTILETAKQHKSDLLVLGSRGLGLVQEWIVGGVSYQVASQAPCPVLLIKQSVEKMQKVMLAYDGSDEADRAADLLDRSLFREKVELTILTVWPEQPPMPPAVASQADALAKRAKQAAVELAEKIKDRLPADRFSCRIEVAEGDPGRTLVSLAKERGIDLIRAGEPPVEPDQALLSRQRFTHCSSPGAVRGAHCQRISGMTSKFGEGGTGRRVSQDTGAAGFFAFSAWRVCHRVGAGATARGRADLAACAGSPDIRRDGKAGSQGAA